MAAQSFGCPIVLIAIDDAAEHGGLSAIGLDASATAQAGTMCCRMVTGQDPVIVSDARRDDRFYAKDLDLGQQSVGFFAGIPIVFDPASRPAILCVMDVEPRDVDDRLGQQLRNLAQILKTMLIGQKTYDGLSALRTHAAKTSADLTRTVYLLDQIKGLTGVGAR